MKWFAIVLSLLLCSAFSVPSNAKEPSIKHKSELLTKQGCYTGVYLNGETIMDYEKYTKKKVAIAMFFSAILTGGESFPNSLAEANWSLGHLTSLTIEPQMWSLQSIIDGKHDDTWKSWAKDVAKFGFPIMLRPMHEMNGNWYGWSGFKNGGSEMKGFGSPTKADGPERYVAAWRHIHSIFTKLGATNVIWVWCPNVDVGLGDWNKIANFYPGDEYVDWMAMDAYNWGFADSAVPGGRWQNFTELYGKVYSELEAINSNKPMMIGEFASEESGGDKGAWIKDTFSTMKTKFPRMKGFVWFNIYKERKWHINSTPKSLNAFREAMKDPYFIGEF